MHPQVAFARESTAAGESISMVFGPSMEMIRSSTNRDVTRVDCGLHCTLACCLHCEALLAALLTGARRRPRGSLQQTLRHRTALTGVWLRLRSSHVTNSISGAGKVSAGVGAMSSRPLARVTASCCPQQQEAVFTGGSPLNVWNSQRNHPAPAQTWNAHGPCYLFQMEEVRPTVPPRKATWA